MQASRLSLAKRMWVPVVITLVMMGMVSVGVTLRTVRLIEESKVQQTAQVAKLGLAAQWPAQAQGYADASSLVLMGDASEATKKRQSDLQAALRDTEGKLKALISHDEERHALAKASEALQGLLAQSPADAAGWSAHVGKALPPLLEAMQAYGKVQVREEEALRAEIAAGRSSARSASRRSERKPSLRAKASVSGGRQTPQRSRWRQPRS